MERQIIEAAVADFRRRYDSSAAIRRLLEKVESGTATYADAQDYVRETMSLQTAIWETWLFPADLPDDEARRRVAAQLTRNVLDENYELVSAYARQVQQELNRKAGIGLKAQRAKQNRSRAEGLVQVASDPDRQVQLPALAENYARSIVDSTVKTNADFQYKAGLRPKIRRISGGKCCEWCSRLAGVYDYPDVPKDVFRRHANCGCVVEYDPGDGKNVRNVHTKQVRSEEEQSELNNRKTISGIDTKRWIREEPKSRAVAENVTPEYLRRATPGIGELVYDFGYDYKRHADEVELADWLHSVLGGDILLLNESSVEGQKTADYLWNGKLWDLKTASTEKSANTAIKRGLQQIRENPGGIILNYGTNHISRNELLEVMDKRMQWGFGGDTVDIIVVQNGEIYGVWRYKNKTPPRQHSEGTP